VSDTEFGPRFLQVRAAHHLARLEAEEFEDGWVAETLAGAIASVVLARHAGQNDDRPPEFEPQRPGTPNATGVALNLLARRLHRGRDLGRDDPQEETGA
jgi:hypothetical protein